VRDDNYMGGFLLRLHLRATQRGTCWPYLRVSVMLGRLGSRRCNHGRNGFDVAYSWRAVPLDIYACARGMEGAFELCNWLVCIHTSNEVDAKVLISIRRQSVIAWQALAASGSYLSATTLQGLIINSQPSYMPAGWHGTLLVFAVVAMCLLFNTFLSKQLPHVESLILVLHITLFVVVLIVLTVMSPNKSTNAEVWTQFLNEGGYESKGLSFFVGLITPVFAFSGADGAVHMSEEIRNSSRIVPWAMMSTFPPPPSSPSL
jgi:amino acid transporter